ncbi:hypothetical protein HBB16_01025 [Pseudonocardia sp. MCCB 268]|nr:hypothetical protein [Pseudonocardia cytotoxica]
MIDSLDRVAAAAGRWPGCGTTCCSYSADSPVIGARLDATERVAGRSSTTTSTVTGGGRRRARAAGGGVLESSRAVRCRQGRSTAAVAALRAARPGGLRRRARRELGGPAARDWPTARSSSGSSAAGPEPPGPGAGLVRGRHARRPGVQAAGDRERRPAVRAAAPPTPRTSSSSWGPGRCRPDALLLTAAAPRMVAVVGDEPRYVVRTTLIEVLNQASAASCAAPASRRAFGNTARTPPPPVPPGGARRVRYVRRTRRARGPRAARTASTAGETPTAARRHRRRWLRRGAREVGPELGQTHRPDAVHHPFQQHERVLGRSGVTRSHRAPDSGAAGT